MFVGIGGQDRIGNGNAAVQLHFAHTACRFVGHNFKVIGITANYRTQCDERIELLALRHGLQYQGDFQRARYIGQRDVVFAHAALHQLRAACRQQALAHHFVETALHDTDAQAFAIQVLFDFLHFVSLH